MVFAITFYSNQKKSGGAHAPPLYMAPAPLLSGSIWFRIVQSRSALAG